METIAAYLPELISFYHIAQTGGFTPAASRLNLSKSNLSKQVARLESLLEVELFHRTTRRVTLTNEGKVLLQYAEQVFRTSEEAFSSIRDLSKKDIGLIRLTAPFSLGDWFAAPMLKLVKLKYPKLKIEIDLANQKRNLIEEHFDFALRAMEETDPGNVARYLGHIKDVICVAPGLIGVNEIRNLQPMDLAKYDCILSSHAHKWNTWQLRKGSQDIILEVSGNVACSSYSTARSLCLEKLGIARIPLYLVEKDLQEKKLLQLFPDHSISTHPLYLVYPARSYRTLAQRNFRDLLLSWISKQEVLLKKVK